MIKMVDGVRDFSQYDTRWASKPYRNLPACLRLNGCGPSSTADIIASRYSVTPDTTRKWLINHNYVVNGAGTIHAGIPAILRAYGFTTKEYSRMPDVFAEFKKGNRCAVFLMNDNVAPSGRKWTGGGHFIAIKGYKTDNGKHYFYVCDPGQRMLDGWACYETQMKRCISKVWIAYMPKPSLPTLPKKGYFTKGDEGKEVKKLQECLNYLGYDCGEADGILGDKTMKAIKKFKKKYGMGVPKKFGKKSLKYLKKALD